MLQSSGQCGAEADIIDRLCLRCQSALAATVPPEPTSAESSSLTIIPACVFLAFEPVADATGSL